MIPSSHLVLLRRWLLGANFRRKLPTAGGIATLQPARFEFLHFEAENAYLFRQNPDFILRL